MTPDEIHANLRTLHAALLIVLREFETATGCPVHSVRFDHHGIYTIGHGRSAVRIELEQNSLSVVIDT